MVVLGVSSWPVLAELPPRFIEQLERARRRSRAQERLETLEDLSVSDGQEAGLGIEGRVPSSNATYKVTRAPYEEHRERLERLARGEDALSPDIQEELRARRARSQWTAFRDSFQA